MPRERQLFSVPGGPHKWGKLLYEPQWAKEKRFSDYHFMMIVSVIPFMAVVMGIIPWIEFSSRLSGLVLPVAAVSYWGLLAGLILYLMYRSSASEVTKMPFRVYEAGFTMTVVPFWKGLRRREVLVPKERVVRVSVKEDATGVMTTYSIAIGYESYDAGKPLELHRGAGEVDDPLAALEALQAIAPERVDDTALPFLDPDRVELADEEPTLQSLTSSFLAEAFGLIMMSSVAGVTIYFLILFAALWVPWLSLLMILIFGTMLVFILKVPAKLLADSTFQNWYRPDTRVDAEGIHSQYTIIERWFLYLKDPFPLDLIRRTRKRLSAYTYNTVFTVELVDGREVAVPRPLHDAVASQEGFERERFRHENSRARERGKSVRAQVFTFAALTLAMTIVVSGLFDMMDMMEDEPPASEEPEEPDETDRIMGIIMMVVLAGSMLMVVPVFLTIMRMSRLQAIEKEYHVDDREIRLPSAKPAFRHLAKEDILSIKAARITRRANWGYMRVETTRGVVELPATMAKELKENGYLVEDDEGLLDGSLIREKFPDKL